MKQLLILSGKGGTGKTTVAGAFIKLSASKVCADCDVDAPNLHLLLGNDEKPKYEDFYGMDKAEIEQSACISCGACFDVCRFEAIEKKDKYEVNPYACEGCGLCVEVCPENAIRMTKCKAGDLMVYNEDRLFSTAKLKMGNGTSGLLVTEVKKRLRSADSEEPLAIIDGSPGIGCPVIASMSGVDNVLIVAEPSVSGISDMKRILDTAKVFGVKSGVVTNKFDTNLRKTAEIKTFCEEHGIKYFGEIPFDSKVVKLVNSGLTAVEGVSVAGDVITGIYKSVMMWVNENSEASFKVVKR